MEFLYCPKVFVPPQVQKTLPPIVSNFFASADTSASRKLKKLENAAPCKVSKQHYVALLRKTTWK